jgi:hypothetical protein
MDSKPKVTLVATAPDGTEIKIRTAAAYDWAGIAKHHDGTWGLLAKGWAWDRVKARTQRLHRTGGGYGLYATGWYVVPFKPLARTEGAK